MRVRRRSRVQVLTRLDMPQSQTHNQLPNSQSKNVAAALDRRRRRELGIKQALSHSCLPLDVRCRKFGCQASQINTKYSRVMSRRRLSPPRPDK